MLGVYIRSMATRATVKKYTCPHCGVVYRTVKHYRAHMASCSNLQNIVLPKPLNLKPAKPKRKAVAQRASGIKKMIDDMAASDILYNCGHMPGTEDTYDTAMGRWISNSQPLGQETYAVELNTEVWPLVLDCEKHVGYQHAPVAEHPSDVRKKTKHEWFFSGQTAQRIDDVVYVPLPDALPYDENDKMSPIIIVGFFVPLPYIYVAGKREGEAARGGKTIVSEVKFAKSKGGGSWTVLVYDDGSKSCNCPSWIFHHAETGGCKHTEKV